MIEDSRRSQRAFIVRLVERVPEFELVVREHVRDNDEVLPNLLMRDFTRWAIDLVRHAASGNESAQELLVRSLRFLESEFETDRQGAVQELISVSFLENLQQVGPDFEALAAHFGPRLRAELERYIDRRECIRSSRGCGRE